MSSYALRDYKALHGCFNPRIIFLFLQNSKLIFMKTKILLFMLVAFTVFAKAQNNCITDKMQQKIESKSKDFSGDLAAKELLLKTIDKELLYKSKGISVTNQSQYVGPIFTIPVIVHVIVPNNEAVGTMFNPTDIQIQNWLEDCNKIFATTFGGNFYAEGSGALDGNVIPFRLALAKRNTSCNNITGVERYYSTDVLLPNYTTFGLNTTTNPASGPSADVVKAFAPHWSEATFFNIYIISGFDGSFNSGSTGFAGGPTYNNSGYDAFIASRLVSTSNNFNNSILPHEMAHALGINHVFGNYDFATYPCPVVETNANCLDVNDNVCDTSPVKPYLNPMPDNTIINPCTNLNFDGTQYNIMGYNDGRKFTAGQRERALTMFLTNRESLTRSTVADNVVGPALQTNACTVTSTIANTNQWKGPTLVQVGDIKNSSLPRRFDNQETYKDYSVQNCYNSAVYTDLKIGQSYTLTIGFVGISQFINAWIDYNNNGVFEATEQIATSNVSLTPTNGYYVNTIWNTNFTPPATSTLNTPLRFRVKAGNNGDACSNEDYGQVEDYTVTLLQNPLNIDAFDANSKNVIWYNKADNKLVSNYVIGNFAIYDNIGKLIQKGNSENKEILLDFNKIGVYILKSDKISMKFIQ